MNKPLIVIFTTVMLDAMGIGIIFPILPTLLKDITHSNNVALYLGLMTMLYALMQFVFAPVLGALSDRIGRRPVLLLSLGGSAINYVFLTFSPTLSLLLLGRALAGMTGASLSVAMAYLTDISTPKQRPRRFGLFSAMFGIGFIVGPVLGGILGDEWIRLPFIIAAVLTGGNFLLALCILPETRVIASKKQERSSLNPLHTMGWILTRKDLLPLVFIFFLFSFAGEAYGICWALWGHDTFQWQGSQIGLSLGAFGVCQTLVQIFLPGPVTQILGERRTVLTGIACGCLALCVMAFAHQGWMVFAIMPIFALGSLGTPALQSLATRQVNVEQQGQFQGILSSAVSLASVIAPLFFSAVYFTVQKLHPGVIWLSVVAMNMIAVPLIIFGIRKGWEERRK